MSTGNSNVGNINKLANNINRYNEKTKSWFNNNIPDYTQLKRMVDTITTTIEINQALNEAQEYRENGNYAEAGKKAGEAASKFLGFLPFWWFIPSKFGRPMEIAIEETGSRMGEYYQRIDDFAFDDIDESNVSAEDWLPDTDTSWENADRSGTFRVTILLFSI